VGLVTTASFFADGVCSSIYGIGAGCGFADVCHDTENSIIWGKENDMADETDSQQLENAILNNAVGPASADTEGLRVTQHNLKDQIAVDRYLASKRAVQKGGLGIILKKLSPPGAT